MDLKSIQQEFVLAKEHYDQLRRKNCGEIHDPLCTLNISPKEKLKSNNYKKNASSSFGKPIKEKDENEDNCCIKNVPCPLIDFQLEKIKQLAESGTPWMNKNWEKVEKNYNNLEEANDDFRTYYTNPKLSMLSPNHQIQLFRVGTFSNDPTLMDELQNDRYNGKAYLKKFQTFENFFIDSSQFYGNIRICRPLEFELPCTSKEEMTMRYQELIYRMSLPDLKGKNEMKDEFLENESKDEDDISTDIDNNNDVVDMNNVGKSSNIQESNKKLSQIQNSNGNNQNLKISIKENDPIR